MSASTDEAERITTGVPGLDTILAGGFLRGSTCIIQGPPGCGKTVLANQIAFHQIAHGVHVLYVTLLAESHTGLFRHLRTMRFFDAEAVGDRIVYLSGHQALRESASALLALLQREILARRPGMLVLDGIASIQELHGSASLRLLLHELQVSTEAARCTSVLISTTPNYPSPEDAVVDAVLLLGHDQIGLRSIRQLRVNKTRGSAHLAGRHEVVIDERGLTVFPRIESVYRMPSRAITDDPSRVGFDHAALDDMLGGGLRAGSSTLLLGATGTGKTLLGLTFLAAGLRRGESAAYTGFYEAPARLVGSGEGIGLALRKHLDDGRFHIDWQAPAEMLLDAWGHLLLEMVEARRPSRLFIDGLNALQENAAYPDRVAPFLTALLNELRARRVTTLISAELHPIIGPTVDVPIPGVSPLVEHTISLRYREVRAHVFRLMSVVKVRGSAHDSAMREFLVTSGGIKVASSFETAESILADTARPPATDRREPDDR